MDEDKDLNRKQRVKDPNNEATNVRKVKKRENNNTFGEDQIETEETQDDVFEVTLNFLFEELEEFNANGH